MINYLFKIKSAFTLIEILLSITVLAILSLLVIIAINPLKTMDDTNRAKILMNLRAIENALIQYIIDNDGQMPLEIDENLRMLGTSSTNCDFNFKNIGYSEESCLDLSPYLVPDFLIDIPSDPKIGNQEKTFYAISKNNNNYISLYAYSLTNDLELGISFTLNYSANEGGSILGNSFQVVNYQESGIEVLAVADENYEFIAWSDGLINNPRIDFNVNSNINVSAIFEPKLIWQNCGDEISFSYKGEIVKYQTVSGQNDTCWLDRNLGASRVPISRTDNQGFGDLFQWGRDDDGHQNRNSNITETLSLVDNPSHSDFIINSNSPGDWRDPQNNALWQGVNGINNPCPENWRLPYEAELQAERLSWQSNDRYGAYASDLKWPSTGYRGGTGSFVVVANFGYAWSASTHNTNARTLAYISNNAYVLSYNRALGFPVRCILD